MGAHQLDPERRCPDPQFTCEQLLAPAEDVPLAASFFGDMKPVLQRFWEYLAVAALCLVPIICKGHWTLLVFERQNKTEPASDKSSGSTPLAIAGCAKCRGITGGCQDCQPTKVLEHLEKRERELEIADPLKYLTSLTDCDDWSVRYYDSLQKEKLECKQSAKALVTHAAAVGVQEVTLDRANSCFQSNADCGFWTLHFMEEEVRNFLGEGRWSKPFDRPYRLDRLQAVQHRLLSTS